MVFPWANGNLRDFWESVKSPQRTQDMARWMLTQCFGIADGLQKIHGDGDVAGLSPNDKNTGRHGDIKPENILWLKRHNDSDNHLLICDFGLCRFHSYQSQSVDRLPGCSPSYRPPECDLNRLKISVKYDIWTLGCLLLDFLTWYLRGWEAVDTLFPDTRLKDEGWTPFNLGSTQDERCLYEDKFYQQSNDGKYVMAQLKPSVIEWMEELHKLDYCPEFAHDLLKIIHKGLLHPDKRQRWDCTRIVNELNRVRERCDTGKAYCTTPSRWKGERLEPFTVSYLVTPNSIKTNAQQQTGPHSPRSLSPASRASHAGTPPPELQDAESLAADDLGITCAILPGNPLSVETFSPEEPPGPVQDTPVTQVQPPPPPPPDTHRQSGSEIYLVTPGTTMDTRRTTNSSRPLLAPPPAGQPRLIGRGKHAWGTCKKCMKTLGCCFIFG
jgi:serine/threonine protein kinase